MFEEQNWYNGGYNNAAAKTYMKCNGFLKQMLQELGIDPVIVIGGPKATNFALVQQMKSLLEKAGKKELDNFSEILSDNDDVKKVVGEEKFRSNLLEKVENLSSIAGQVDNDLERSGLMVDDIAPNEFKQSLAAVSANYLSEERTCILPARKLFREVLDDIYDSKVVRRRINVVEGNFPRMYGYLIEIYDEQIGLSPYGRGKNINTAKVRIG